MVTQPAPAADTYGLVLAGGGSVRMGRDKGLLDYVGKPHRFFVADVLLARCARVFVSVNADQPRLDEAHYDYLVDRAPYAGNGPIGALLGASEAHPGRAWFVVSCDLPFFDAACADYVLARRDRDKLATAFLNPDHGRPEPLVTIYESEFLAQLPAQFARGQRSLMRILHLLGHTNLLSDYDARWIFSADTPDAFDQARRDLGR